MMRLRLPRHPARRVRLAGILVCLGLLVELASLGWSHPTSFLLFVIAGGTSLAVGIAIYLWWLVLERSDPRRGAPPATPTHT